MIILVWCRTGSKAVSIQKWNVENVNEYSKLET